MGCLISELRCKACDDELTDQESTRKGSNEEYLDMCNDCVKYVDIDWVIEDREEEDD